MPGEVDRRESQGNLIEDLLSHIGAVRPAKSDWRSALSLARTAGHDKFAGANEASLSLRPS